MAINLLNNISSTGSLTITKPTTDPLLTIHNTTNGGGVAIRFIDTSGGSQPGDLTYKHSDSQSQGGGASWHFVAENQTHVVVGDGSKIGRVIVKSGGNVAKADYAFFDDINTGMLRTSADNVSLVAGGVANVGVGSTAVSLKYAGTTKLTTLNTGIQVAGDGTFSGSITTTSASGIKIDTTGNALLQLDGASGSTEAIIFKHSGTEVSRISHSNSTDLVFSTGSSVDTALTLSGLNATFAGRVMADTHFQSSDTNATLSATGNGNVYLRPNGYSTTTGQVHINTSGNATFAGTINLSSNKGVVWPGGSIRAEGNTLKLVATTLIDLQQNTQVQGTLTTTGNATFAGTGTFEGGGNTLTLKKGTGTPALAFAGTATDPQASALIEGIAGGGLKIYTSNGGTIGTPGWSPKFDIAAGGNATFAGDVTVSGGDITLGGTGRIQGVDTISDPTDAANKAYVDAHDGGAGVYLPLAGGTMLGDIVMQDELLNFKSGGSSILPQFLGHRSSTDLNSRSWTTEGGWAYTTFDSGSSNTPSAGLHNGNGLLSFNTHSGNYMAQIAMTTNTGKLWHRRRNGSGWLTWYQIYSTQDFSTTNISNWNTAYNNMVTAVSITGTTTKTITLTQQDGGTVSSTFTAGVVQSVGTGNSNTITIGGTTANPEVAANTAAVSSSSAELATGAQIQTAINTAIGTIPSGLAFEGNWNANTDSPDLSGASPDNGQFWIVSVAGSTNLSGITDWKVGDWAIYVATGAGTDGWQKVDNTSTLSGAGTVNALPLWTGTTSLGTSRFTQSSTQNLITGPGNASSDNSLRVNNLAGTNQLYIQGTGEVVVTQNYFYVAASQGMYSNGLARLRGGVTDDQGNLNLGGSGSIGNLTLTSNTAASFAGTLSVGSITNATTDTDRFLVSDGSVIKYRTGAQLRSDIGAGTGSGNVTGGGSAGRVAYWTTGSNIASDEAFLWDATNDMLDTRTLLVSNARVATGQKYSPGHYTPGETIWEIDPTWTDKQLKELFNNNNVSWSTNSIAQDAPGGYAIYINGGVSVGGVYGSGFPYIPVDNDGVYYMECYIKNVGTNTHYMGSNEFNATFTSTGGNPGSFGYWVMSNTNPGTSWTKVSGYIGGFDSSQTGKFELATKYWTPQALFNYTNSSGTRACYISGWKAVRVDAPGNRYFDNNVNIGLNSLPTTRLQVSSSGANGIDISEDTSATSNSGRLFFSTDTVSEGVALLNGNGTFYIRTGAQPGSTSGTSKFSITAAGNTNISGFISTPSYVYAGGAVRIPYASASKMPMIVLNGATTYGLFHTEASADIFSFDFNGSSKQSFDQNGNATFVGKGFSAATTTSDASTTLTTKGYVDGLTPGAGVFLPLVGGTMANTNLVTNMNADLLDGLNSGSFLRNDATDTASQRIVFSANATNNWDTIATSAGSQGGIEIYNTGSGNDAFMTFHAGNDFAFYFGIDADNNQLSVGGWSMGANKYKVWNESNDGAGSGLDADLLDGLQATSFLRSDAADTSTGEILFDAGFKSDSILLSGAQNFDNISRSGFYNLYNTSSGSTNSPPLTYGTMIVVGGNKQSQTFGLQIAHERTGAGMYVRGMNDSGSTWYEEPVLGCM